MEAALNSALGRFALGPDTLRIGRAPDNTFVLQDPQSSSHHAEVAPAPGGSNYQVTDLGSTNGTFVNEQRLAPHSPRPLNAGDVIRIGQTSITYEASGASYAPTVLASPPGYVPTMAAEQPSFTPPPQPMMPPQPQAYGNIVPPAQPPYTPPPAYPQPQPAYPQPQAAYPQGGTPYMPQPAYAPPGFGQPGYPQKKSHTGLIITLVVILVLLVGGGGVGFYLLTRSTPQKTLAAYCDGLKTSNATELYNTLTSAEQAQTSVNKIQTALNAISLIGGVKDCTVNSVTENGSTATGNITLTPNRGPSSSGNVHLVDENGTWKIDTSSNNSLPNQ